MPVQGSTGAGGLGGELPSEPEGGLWIRQLDCGLRPQWVHLTYGQIPVHRAIVVPNARRFIMQPFTEAHCWAVPVRCERGTTGKNPR